MFNQETTLASNSFNQMLKRNPELTKGFTSINTPTFKHQWEQEFELANSKDVLGSIAGMTTDEFTKSMFSPSTPTVSFGAFDDKRNDLYSHEIMKAYEEEFPNSPPLGGYHQGIWHGASRIPRGKHEGRYLKQIGHPTLHLSLLSDLNYHEPVSLTEGISVKNMDEDDITGRPNPHVIYYTEEKEGQRVLYSFPKNKRVDPRFKPIEKEYLDMLLQPSRNIIGLNKYIQSNEVPIRRDGTPQIPGKEGNIYKAYADSGKDGYLTIGIGHLVDPRKKGSVPRTARMLRQINPLLDVQAIIRKEQGLTKSEVFQLFEMDVQEKIDTTRRVFPHLHTYPEYVQIALIDATYWGMLGKSPTTRKLIKLGRINEAKEEWLDNKTYRRGESRYRFMKFYDALDQWAKDKQRWGD
tara:strand:- start:2757 stop:3980 length:1224 start_codon:yes stop_codon:yes gene_type:complete